MCRLMLALRLLAGSHRYSPESAEVARWMSRCDVVLVPFSITTLTPPRAESYEIIWKRRGESECW